MATTPRSAWSKATRGSTTVWTSKGSNSNAALARLLDLPVVLVLDARGMTRGIAPLILGYQAFDRTSASPA
jgi:cobyrinic acid a,c-diamide synthase